MSTSTPSRVNFRRSLEIKNESSNLIVDACAVENETPNIARIAAMDYLLNCSRARTNIGGFIGPRWVPDPEATVCSSCHKPFDWINRKHHCRHCGKIFCQPCSSEQCLLPTQFGYKAPQRVCVSCDKILKPQQQYFTSRLADYQRINNISVTSTEETCEGCSPRRYLNLPFSKTLGSEVRKAAYTVYNIIASKYIKDSSLPTTMMSKAWGLVFITTVRAGCVFGGMFGTGLMVARLQDGRWSGPIAIGVGGMCWGALIGLDVTDYVIVLNSPDAVRSFSGKGQLSVSVGACVCAANVGRSIAFLAGVGDEGYSLANTYSQSRGLFAGLFVQGLAFFSRAAVNERFYGSSCCVADILNGIMEPPRAAEPLYNALRDAEALAPGVTHKKSAYSQAAYGSTYGGQHPSSLLAKSSNNRLKVLTNGDTGRASRLPEAESDSDSEGFHEFTSTLCSNSHILRSDRIIVVSESPSSFGWKSYATTSNEGSSEMFAETGGLIRGDSDLEDVSM